MPIEFRCDQCGKLLRTGDDTAGRKAQCPECGALSTVPGMTEPSEAPIPPLPSQPIGGGSPFMPGSATVRGENPFGPGTEGAEAKDSGNPYQSPYVAGPATFGPGDPFALQRVSGPATALIVFSSICMVLQALAIVVNVVQMVTGHHVKPPPGDDFAMIYVMSEGIVGIVSGIFSLAMGALIFIGASKMKRLESYSFAMAAAIIAMLPCVSPCCFLGLPFGIWALVVLNDVPVKRAFRS
jgi:hypothetical protein